MKGNNCLRIHLTYSQQRAFGFSEEMILAKILKSFSTKNDVISKRLVNYVKVLIDSSDGESSLI